MKKKDECMTLSIISLIVSVFSSIFCGAQVLISRKQKNLELFKLRIEHYLNLNRLIKIFKELFEHENSKYLLVSRQLKELEDIELGINNLKNESSYLFGDDIFDLEADLSRTIHSCIVSVQAFCKLT